MIIQNIFLTLNIKVMTTMLLFSQRKTKLNKIKMIWKSPYTNNYFVAHVPHNSALQPVLRRHTCVVRCEASTPAIYLTEYQKMLGYLNYKTNSINCMQLKRNTSSAAINVPVLLHTCYLSSNTHVILKHRKRLQIFSCFASAHLHKLVCDVCLSFFI